jgi:hypothetical protein
MKRAGCRTAFAVTLGAAGAAALIGTIGALAPVAATAADKPVTAADCRAIKDFEQRGQCWDTLDKQNQKDTQAVNKRDFGLNPNAVAEAQQKKAEAQQKKEAAAEAKAEAKKEHVAKVKTPKAPKPENDGVHSLLLTVADVVNTDSGGIMITASDGAVWEQTDGDIINGVGPQRGDTFKVSKGFLGGYMCQISRWQSIRCQRDK